LPKGLIPNGLAGAGRSYLFDCRVHSARVVEGNVCAQELHRQFGVAFGGCLYICHFNGVYDDVRPLGGFKLGTSKIKGLLCEASPLSASEPQRQRKSGNGDWSKCGEKFAI
jgi:hypothetical protein